MLSFSGLLPPLHEARHHSKFLSTAHALCPAPFTAHTSLNLCLPFTNFPLFDAALALSYLPHAAHYMHCHTLHSSWPCVTSVETRDPSHPPCAECGCCSACLRTYTTTLEALLSSVMRAAFVLRVNPATKSVAKPPAYQQWNSRLLPSCERSQHRSPRSSKSLASMPPPPWKASTLLLPTTSIPFVRAKVLTAVTA